MSKLRDPLKSSNKKTRSVVKELERRRGRIGDMYRTLLNHPELAHRIGALGEYIRFRSKLRPDIRELAILYTSRQLDAPYEWVSHIPYAIKAGLPPEIIELLRLKRDIGGVNKLYSQALKVVQHVLDRKSIPAPLQTRLIKAIGIESVIELVVIAGFYTMIAGVVSAFNVPLPNK